MPSVEGRGRARAAWDAYARATNRVIGPVLEPLIGPAVKSYSAGAVSDLIGFWLMWHLYGGFDGLRELGMSRASIFRKVSTFRKIFKVHPDEYELPGIAIDVATYQATLFPAGGNDTPKN